MCRTRSRRFVATAFLCIVPCIVAGCRSSSPAGVLQRFGIEDEPSDSGISAETVIREKLGMIAIREMQRLNNLPESNRVVFVPTPDDPLGGGKYFREQRIYDRWYLVEISKGRGKRLDGAGQSRSKSSSRNLATVAYRYRLLKSYRLPSRQEALSTRSMVASQTMDYERYRYVFDSRGEWDGKPGKLVK